MTKVFVIGIVSLLLAGITGAMTAIAVGAANPPQPVRTVTVTLHDGATGATGATGADGSIACPEGFVTGEVIINHPGGQVTIYGCINK